MVRRKSKPSAKKWKSPGDVKVSLKLSDLKPPHAKWVVEMYEYLKEQKESFIKGFPKAGIMEAVKSAQDIYTTIGVENRRLIIDCLYSLC